MNPVERKAVRGQVSFPFDVSKTPTCVQVVVHLRSPIHAIIELTEVTESAKWTCLPPEVLPSSVYLAVVKGELTYINA